MIWQGFYEGGFMTYLQYRFPNFVYERELVQNLVDYAYEHQHAAKDQFCTFLSDLLPEVEFGEVAAFMEDGYLTPAYGIPEKRRVMEQQKIQICAEYTPAHPDGRVNVDGEELTVE